MADGQIPISAVLTSASLHDSQVAIPLATMSTQRVTYCYELMDAAYEAQHIVEQSRQLGHIPIVDPKAPGGPKSQAKGIPMDKPKRELSPAQRERYKERTMVERVNARLKDEFGGRNVRVRGAAKVMAHLMFGVLALTADQLLRLVRHTLCSNATLHRKVDSKNANFVSLLNRTDRLYPYGGVG